MKKFLVFTLFMISIVCGAFFSCKHKITVPEEEIAHIILIQIDSFAALCNDLKAKAEGGSADEKKLQTLFLQTRLAYKRFEWAAEYFEPATSKTMNGPPVQEVELSGQVFEPSGLQIMENVLFPTYDTSRKKQLIKQLAILQAGCDRYRT